MMTADDFLRTSPVTELRRVVIDLDKEASSKKTELQLMVGSKYLDFIQSAESIRNMQQSVDDIQNKLGAILHSSQNLASSNLNSLLSSHPKLTTTPKSDNRLNPFVRSNSSVALDVFNNANVSECMKTGRISAKKNIESPICSEFKSTKLLNIDSFTVWSNLEKCDISNASKIIVIAALLLSNENEKQTSLQDLKSFGSMLSNNIKSDITTLHIPKAIWSELHSVSFLLDTVVDDANAFLFLKESSALNVTEYLAMIGFLQHGNRITLLEKLLAVRDRQLGMQENVSSEHLKNSLVAFVQILQKTILDVFLIFVQVPPNCSEPGLLGCVYREFLSSVQVGLQEKLSEYSTDAQSFDYTLRCSMDDVGPDYLRNVRKCFENWFASAVERCSILTARTLSVMDSAASVATLQQYVWQVSLSFKDCNSVISNQYTSSDGAWEAACLGLLAPTRRRKADLDTPPSHLLWIQALRQPFLHHVEHMLRDSCLNVLEAFKHKVYNCLEIVGLSVDQSTLKVSESLHSRQSCAPPSIFRYATILQQTIESELDSILGNTHNVELSGKNSHDPDISAALKRALFFKCAQLAAQISVFMRTLLDSLVSFLRNIKAKGKAVVNSDPYSAVLYALLLVGRVSWFIRNQGGLLEHSLAQQHASLTANQSASEEQLRSAFDIADSNGDGQVSYEEALDAILALAIHGDLAKQISLSAKLTPTLSFSEFALLCAPLLQDAKTQLRYFECLEHIAESAHRHSAKILLIDLQEQLEVALFEDIGLNSKSTTFTALWTSHQVDLDLGQSEAVLLPSAPSAAFVVYFNRLNRRVNEMVLSVDTVQDLSGLRSESSDRRRATLFSFASEFVFDAVLLSIVSTYDALMKDFATSNTPREERCVLQVLMDLSVARDVLQRCNVMKLDLLDSAKRKWERKLDPINAQLMLPLLWSAARLASLQTYLMFSAYHSPPKEGASNVSVSESVWSCVFSAQKTSRFALLPLAISAVPARLNNSDELDRLGNQVRRSVKIDEKRLGHNFRNLF